MGQFLFSEMLAEYRVGRTTDDFILVFPASFKK